MSAQINVSLDYDACGIYGADSPSCRRVVKSWREALSRDLRLISEIANVYAEFYAPDDERLREVLKAQVELMLALWLSRTAELSDKARRKLDDIIYKAYSTLQLHGVFLDVPCDVELLEHAIFFELGSVLHTLSVALSH